MNPAAFFAPGGISQGIQNLASAFGGIPAQMEALRQQAAAQAFRQQEADREQARFNAVQAFRAQEAGREQERFDATQRATAGQHSAALAFQREQEARRVQREQDEMALRTREQAFREAAGGLYPAQATPDWLSPTAEAPAPEGVAGPNVSPSAANRAFISQGNADTARYADLADTARAGMAAKTQRSTQAGSKADPTLAIRVRAHDQEYDAKAKAIDARLKQLADAEKAILSKDFIPMASVAQARDRDLAAIRSEAEKLRQQQAATLAERTRKYHEMFGVTDAAPTDDINAQLLDALK